MICPNCREDNAPTFRFCGMCGTALEPRRTPGTPSLNPLTAFPAPPPSPTQRVVNAEPPEHPVAVVHEPAKDVRPIPRHVPPISGPSMLGLNQPVLDRPTSNPTTARQSDPTPLNTNLPSMDSLRERSFTGLDSFLETEEPKTGARRVIWLIVLLAALAGASWWIYNNYLGTMEKRLAETTSTPSTASTQPETPAPNPAPKETTPAPEAAPSSAKPSSNEVAEGPSENAAPAPDTTAKTPVPEAKPASPPAAAPAEPAAPRKHEPRRQPVAAATRTPSADDSPTDTGDSAFRKGEAFLYGRGVRENCDEAVKNLKAASAKSNAKARSAFGTMYATGHCVPRDLPTSYTWFALALRVDPNNQILEKDLSAVWNQMTPPERQMATRMKQ